MPLKNIKDKNLSPPASPPPHFQHSTRRKSRGEQINFRLPIDPASPSKATFQKRKKNWRSPSNPIDFHMNCELIARAAETKTEIKERISPVMIPSSPSLTPGSPCQTAQIDRKQLNFYKNSPKSNKSNESSNKSGSLLAKSEDLKVPEMTVIKSEKVRKPSSRGLQSYETMLLRAPQATARKFEMIAELSISPIVSTGSSDYTSTRRHVFTFESSYCQADSPSESHSSFDSTSLAHGHIDPFSQAKRPVTFSRCSLLQVILRNPQDNSVAGIFVVKLELSDMPAETRTILRQKAYKSKCLTEGSEIDSAPDYLAKFIEIPLKRSYDPDAKRQKIQLSGPIRVAFSFNRSNLRYTSPRRSDASAVEPAQKTHTVLQFPCKDQKYFPLLSETTTASNHDRLRSNSLTTESATRSFQHGSLCL